MSLITRCPACATTFKVVRDQLRISDGWVRCGRCGDVFDATLDLRDTDEAPKAGEETKHGSHVPLAVPSTDAVRSDVHDESSSLRTRVDPVERREEPWLSDRSDTVALGSGQHGEARPDPGFDAVASPVPRDPAFDASPQLQPMSPTLDSLQSTHAPEQAAARGIPRVETADGTLPVHGDGANASAHDDDRATGRSIGVDAAPAVDIDASRGVHGRAEGVEPEPARPATDSAAPGRPKWWSRQPSLDMPKAAPVRARFSSGEFDPVPVPSMPEVPIADAGSPAEAGASASSSSVPSSSASMVQQAVDAQLQKALRRARVLEARASRSRARQPGGSELEPAFASGSNPAVALGTADPLDLPVVQRAAADAVIERELTDESLPGFLDTGKPRRRKRLGRGARVAWSVAALALVLVLLLQVGRHERDLIAASVPALRPALNVLCRHTGCALSPVRQIASIRIEGASFVRERDGYQLSFTLRNAAALPLAMPAVELILLDTQERPVVRRVLLPQEFNAPALMAARSDREAVVSMGWSAREAASMPRVVGYRIDPFYP